MKTTTTTIKDIFAQYPTLSLRKLSIATNISYGVLLKAAKQPVANTIYDPNATNFDALQSKFDAKKIDLSTINYAELTTEIRSKATVEEDLTMDSCWTIRGNETVWQIVALTDSHVCVRGYDAALEQLTLRSMSKATFLHQSPKHFDSSELVEA